MRHKPSPVLRRPLLLFVLASVLVALAAGTAGASTERAEADSAQAPGPATAAQWRALVARAKREGSVAFYSGQAPLVLANMAEKFKQKYGISVFINRQVDATLATQVTAEIGTGRAVADIWVSSAKRYVVGALRNGWVVDARSPNLFLKRFNRKTHTLGSRTSSGSRF